MLAKTHHQTQCVLSNFQALVGKATGAFKSVGLLCFMMWMSGSQLHIFSIMSTMSGIFQPLSAIASSGKRARTSAFPLTKGIHPAMPAGCCSGSCPAQSDPLDPHCEVFRILKLHGGKCAYLPCRRLITLACTVFEEEDKELDTRKPQMLFCAIQVCEVLLLWRTFLLCRHCHCLQLVQP